MTVDPRKKKHYLQLSPSCIAWLRRGDVTPNCSDVPFAPLHFSPPPDPPLMAAFNPSIYAAVRPATPGCDSRHDGGRIHAVARAGASPSCPRPTPSACETGSLAGSGRGGGGGNPFVAGACGAAAHTFLIPCGRAEASVRTRTAMLPGGKGVGLLRA